MDPGYTVTKRGPAGEPTEISCVAHAGCAWTMAMSGPKKDDDPIFRAMHGRHMERRLVPDRPVVGHERRKRT